MSKILITGGYGKVGSIIAKELAKYYPQRIIIAGRNIQKAIDFTKEYDGDIFPIELNVNDSSNIETALKDVSLIINCIDLKEPFFLVKSAITKGIGYLDVTAHESFMRVCFGMKKEAEKSGARILLGAGLIPGVANVMAKAGAIVVGKADSVQTNLLLSVGDKFGSAALDYMLEVLPLSFNIIEKGKERKVRNLIESSKANFIDPINERTVYRYILPDQFFYPNTLGVHTSGSFFALDPVWIMKIFVASMKVGTGTLLKFKTVRIIFKKLFLFLQNLYNGKDIWAITVDVKGSEKRCILTIKGYGETYPTAIGAVIKARTLFENKVNKPGIWLPEQVIEPNKFFIRLEEYGLKVNISETNIKL
jgi:saccharopine dehydrogenase-like NADP-dependent oxidoreductase